METDDNFVYLGAQLSYNGHFQNYNQCLVDQVCNVMFAVPRKSGNYIYQLIYSYNFLIA